MMFIEIRCVIFDEDSYYKGKDYFNRYKQKLVLYLLHKRFEFKIVGITFLIKINELKDLYEIERYAKEIFEIINDYENKYRTINHQLKLFINTRFDITEEIILIEIYRKPYKVGFE